MKAPLLTAFPSCPKCGHGMFLAPIDYSVDVMSLPKYDPLAPRVVRCINERCGMYGVRYVMQPMLVDLVKEDTSQ